MALIEAVSGFDPELKGLLNEQVGDYEMVLSTLFLADVVRWANEQYLSGATTKVAELLQLLEARYAHGDGYVRQLIAVGFVESMDSSDEPAAGMRLLLGPSLQAEYSALNH
jgi:hypothetical protein